MNSNRIVIRHVKQLVTNNSSRALKGREMEDNLQVIKDGGIWIENGVIKKIGSDQDVWKAVCDHGQTKLVTSIDASQHLVTPGLVDPHTHLVFGGSREDEFEMRLKGAAYMDIMNAGGGIHRTTSATAAATEEALIAQSKERLDTFLRHGVTTIEAKSGYGLTLEHERKQLQVAAYLNQTHPITIVSTFMGAHAVPKEFKEDSDRFVDILVNEMIPAIASEKLAKFNDVFCEKGVFTPAQSKRILEAGKKYGLIPKIHADEIVSYGGAELAAEVGAISADHLLKASNEGIEKMAAADVVGVLLPATAFFLMESPANARKMIEAGMAVALSTDRNPGSSPTESMPFVMNLACLTMGMTPKEVVTASTMNAASAIGEEQRVGSLEVGKQADLVFWNAPNYTYLQYHIGVNMVDKVFKAGKLVVNNGVVI
ncbi:imidazolonepropionase [Alkalihalobacillus sp. LMS6]|uniref:imidazolonepropionase n=1 Tax=Alkalihalobacillus sp. LMS6 TaxID=2924034 RepID=UPI0020D1BF0B|nr:imidazolonepropionase [Alkalihalobacillus sp. LMS6]UTR06834.1 imidazolonepropionase [Alkalihalobacillus sp. LMS6]